MIYPGPALVNFEDKLRQDAIVALQQTFVKRFVFGTVGDAAALRV